MDRGSIFGECLKYLQITIGGIGLVQTSFHHRQLVISGRRITADLYVFPEQVSGFWILLATMRRLANSNSAGAKSGLEWSAC